MAAAVLLAGLVGAAVLLFLVVDEVTSAGLERFSTTAPAEVELPAGAERTIYTGDPTADSGFFRADPACQVVHVASAEAVPTRPVGSLTLTVGDEVYQAALAFKVVRAGRHRISCPADSAQPIPMAVGPRLRVLRSFGRILGAGLVAFVALALAVLIAVLTAVKRHEARR